MDGRRVHAWFSVMSGRSEVYVDGHCVRAGRCFRRRGAFDITLDDYAFKILFVVAGRGRLFVTLCSPDGDESSQCAAFQVPPWAGLASVVVDFVCAYFLMLCVYEDTLSPWLALITFLGVIFTLTSIERCLFGRLRIVEPDTPVVGE
ncbi:hypothetical protein D3260_15300 [Salinisphaera sp. Q1T1-3]|nr:hypothetical protein D3260_15300 [Salinisphaera sp. Q1T1-3]